MQEWKWRDFLCWTFLLVQQNHQKQLSRAVQNKDPIIKYYFSWKWERKSKVQVLSINHTVIFIWLQVLQIMTGLPAGVVKNTIHYGSFFFLPDTSDSHTVAQEKKKKKKKEIAPLQEAQNYSASHLEQIRMRGRMKRAGMTFASHPSEFVVMQSIRFAFSLAPSQWWTWSSPPCALPVILALLARWPVRGPAKAGNAPVLGPRGTHASEGIWQ